VRFSIDSFFNGLKTYGKKNQLKNSNVLVIFLSILCGKKNSILSIELVIYHTEKLVFAHLTSVPTYLSIFSINDN